MPDAEFSKIGEAFGAYGEKVTDPDDVPAALARAVEGGARRPRGDPARAGDEAVERRSSARSERCASWPGSMAPGIPLCSAQCRATGSWMAGDKPGHDERRGSDAMVARGLLLRCGHHMRSRLPPSPSPPPTPPAPSRSSSPTAPAARPISSRARSRRSCPNGSASPSSSSTGRAPAAPSASRPRCAPKPDGYTLYVGYTAETVVVPQISKTATYSVVDDFEPIAITGLVPVVLMVSKNIKADNLKDFIAEVRANPGKYTYGGGVRQPAAHHGRLDEQAAGAQRHAHSLPRRRAGHHRRGRRPHRHVLRRRRGGEGRDRRRLGQGARGDRRHALRRAAQRADLQGGRRAGVRSGELDRDAGAEGHAGGHRRRCPQGDAGRRSTIRRPARRWRGRASSRARTRTCGPSSRTSATSSAARCASSASPWGNE